MRRRPCRARRRRRSRTGRPSRRRTSSRSWRGPTGRRRAGRWAAPRPRGGGRPRRWRRAGSARRSATTDDPAGTAMTYIPSGGDRVDDVGARGGERVRAGRGGRAGGEGDDVRGRRARRGGRGRRAGLGGRLDRRLDGRIGAGSVDGVGRGIGRRVGRGGRVGRGRGVRRRRGVGGAPSDPARAPRWDRAAPSGRARAVGFGRRRGLRRRGGRLGVGRVGGRHRDRREQRRQQEHRLDDDQQAEAPRSGTSTRSCAPEIPRFPGPPAPRRERRPGRAAAPAGSRVTRSGIRCSGREEQKDECGSADLGTWSAIRSGESVVQFRERTPCRPRPTSGVAHGTPLIVRIKCLLGHLTAPHRHMRCAGRTGTAAEVQRQP